MAFKKRCILGCSAEDDVTFFRFPKNDELHNLWLQLLIPIKPDLASKSKKTLLHCMLCSLHFEEKYITANGKRKMIACPTLFTEEEVRLRKPSAPVMICKFCTFSTYIQAYLSFLFNNQSIKIYDF